MLKLKQVVKPAIEPVTYQQILVQLKFDDADADTISEINRLITAAREWCEGHQNRAYITQKFELALDCWPAGRRIRLPRPPLQAIDAVTFRSEGETPVVWDAGNYEKDDYSEPGYLVKNQSVAWPSVTLGQNGLVVRYTAGYGSAASDVPEKIKQAIILLTGYWFENGICDPPNAVYSLLSQDRVVPPIRRENATTAERIRWLGNLTNG